MDGVDDALLGQKALEKGLLTPHQLRTAMSEQSYAADGNGETMSLGFILVTNGYLTEAQLQALTRELSPEKPPAQAGPALAPGTAFGKYRIERELGRGGSAVVVEAVDEPLGRKVALKMLLPVHATDPDEARRDDERFVREARITAQLPKHPHIVGVYEAGEIDGRRYIAMELVEGQEFQKAAKKGGSSRRLQIRLLRDVALAVHHAHQHGVIHRDLKPSNILIDARNEPHVTDFGLARPARSGDDPNITRRDLVVGTPIYMSPEQAQGRPVDRRADVYALGVMLYEILTGRPPFRGSSPLEIMLKVVNEPAAKPSTVFGATIHQLADKTIEKICLKAIAKKPSDRYVTMKLFAEDLTRWLGGEVVRIKTPGQDRSVLWTLIASAAAVLIAIVVLIARRPGPDASAADLAQAEALVAEGNHVDALIVYGRVLGRDPSRAEALKGRDKVAALLEKKSHPAAKAPPAAAPPVPRQEGEFLRLVSCSRGRTEVQSGAARILSKGTWSGDAQLFWTGGRPRDRLRLGFTAPSPGRATVLLVFTQAPDYGIVRVSVNGEVLDRERDLYSQEILATGEIEYRGVELHSGENELQFEIIGTNPKAEPVDVESDLFQMGVDYIAVKMARPPGR